MKEAKVIIGSNFGDEGKGLMTDYFCHELSKENKCLNVRFNGGAQAGHTVVTPNGRRHVFHHFGAGSFNKNVSTYLAPNFVVNPILFRKEWEQLQKLGVIPKVYIDRNCLVTIPSDMMINQIVESQRGDSKHGSCGVGIFETITRFRALHDTTIDNFFFRFNILSYLKTEIKDYSLFRLKQLGIENIKIEDIQLLENENIFLNFLEDVNFMIEHSTLTCENDMMLEFADDNVVFEGAQGLLLDQQNISYFPNLTPSNTGVRNIKHLFNDLYSSNIEVIYITRPYFTRHGAGKFITECDKSNFGSDNKIVDITNHYNDFQGNFRYGYFDVDLFNKSINNDFSLFRLQYPKVKTCICVTHLDECVDIVMDKDVFMSLEGLEEIVGHKVKYTSNGFTRNNVNLRGIL